MKTRRHVQQSVKSSLRAFSITRARMSRRCHSFPIASKDIVLRIDPLPRAEVISRRARRLSARRPFRRFFFSSLSNEVDGTSERRGWGCVVLRVRWLVLCRERYRYANLRDERVMGMIRSVIASARKEIISLLAWGYIVKVEYGDGFWVPVDRLKMK